MAGNRRVARLNEQLKRELMELLQNDVRDPRIGSVTVTAVEVTPDLYHAKVYVTALDAQARAEILTGLGAAAPFLRGELGRRLKVRRAPELHFTWDETLENAQRIERLLAETRAQLPPETDDNDA